MEKWKIAAEIDSTMSGMDISQISELATAIMESWATASPANPAQGNLLDVQSQDPAKFPIKQEPFDFPGTMHHQGFLHQQGQQQLEQVPMDELLDPLESFSFWDGENFYCHDQRMAVDPAMPPLPEYDDEMTRGEDDDEDDMLRDLRSNPTLAELNSREFDYSLNSGSSFFGEDSSNYQLELLSKSFPAAVESQLEVGLSKSFPAGVAIESHFVSSPVPSGSTFGLNYVPSGYIDIKQNVQPSLSSSCPAPSRLQQPQMHLGQQFLDSRFPPLCPQNSPASDSSYFGAASGGGHQNHVTLDSPSHMAPSSPLRVAQSNRFQQQDSSGLLSSSAPPDVTMASYFRTKVKTEPLSSSPSGSVGPRSVTERSLSGFSSLSLSNDDESGSFFDDDEEDDDFSSDEDIYQYESDDPLSTSFPPSGTEKAPRKHRYFWQYNLQSRGARAQHILPRGPSSSDPHAPSDPFDPVFHEECALPVKHSGKARRGDGNDLTPDPRKLHGIGAELRALNRAIYCVEGGGGNTKPLSRKEKNKLASRVCRLKKKAQHEANKIKLYGLQQEHKKLLNILIDTRELLKYKIENLHDKKVSNCSKKLETFLAANDPYKVAGNTATFVNEVLEKVSKGEPDGGLGRL